MRLLGVDIKHSHVVFLSSGGRMRNIAIPYPIIKILQIFFEVAGSAHTPLASRIPPRLLLGMGYFLSFRRRAQKSVFSK